MANNLAGAEGPKAVLDHYPCADVVFAALAAFLYHSALCCRLCFCPTQSTSQVRDLKVDGVDVFYPLNFAGPQGFAVELAQKTKQVVALDYHKTALDNLPQSAKGPEKLGCVIDTNRNGATISYDYFEERLLSDRTDAQAFPASSERTSLVPGSNNVNNRFAAKWYLARRAADKPLTDARSSSICFNTEGLR